MTCPKADEALILAHAKGETNWLPVWLVEPEIAGRLHVSLLELWWMQDHGYSDRLVQFQRAWAIQAEHADAGRARAPVRQVTRPDWRGGACDPTEFTVFEDDAA